jgi:tRNA dimethylallyltransferase
MPREQLRRRIEERIVRMMEMGWLEEVRGLLAKGYGIDAPAMQAVGYQHLARHLAGEMTLEEAIAATKTETWQYARRQLTWFRGEKDLMWLDVGRSQPQELAEHISARAAKHFAV